MSRLTYKENFDIPEYKLLKGRECQWRKKLKNENYELIDKAINKLGKLEDLEEQLGCPLEVREQAFNNGFYDENGNHYICEHYVPYLKQMHTKGIMTHTEKRFRLKDYKKTWWLKKDKSE